MSVYNRRPIQRIQLLGGGLLAGICLFLLSVIISAASTFSADVSAQSHQAGTTATAVLNDDPNVIAGSMSDALQSLGYSAAAFGTALQDSFIATSRQVGNSAAAAGSLAYSGTSTAVGAAGSLAGYLLHAAGQSVSFVTYGTVSLIGAMSHTAGHTVSNAARLTHIDSVIRPADDTAIPIIDPASPELAAALAAMPASGVTSQTPGNPAPNAAGNGPAWPIHGDITTLFGVPHWPYQPTHTGIDISDGKAPGTTPVTAFRAGKVLNVIHSSRGLGNHVIVDHGSGVTSVYAHLHSTSVQPGQQVGTSTVLGYEGSTGTSTGTHLHFEVRVNGQATDPMQFVSGRP